MKRIAFLMAAVMLVVTLGGVLELRLLRLRARFFPELRRMGAQ